MKPSDFSQIKYGRLSKGAYGYWAYIPHPLPPDIDLTIELVRELSEADRSLSELAGIARMLPNPHLLIGPFVRREAVLSSRIEGTLASLSDLFFFEAAKMKEKEVPDVREVSNYVRVLEYGLVKLMNYLLVSDSLGKFMQDCYMECGDRIKLLANSGVLRTGLGRPDAR